MKIEIRYIKPYNHVVVFVEDCLHYDSSGASFKKDLTKVFEKLKVNSIEELKLKHPKNFMYDGSKIKDTSELYYRKEVICKHEDGRKKKYSNVRRAAEGLALSKDMIYNAIKSGERKRGWTFEKVKKIESRIKK